MSIRVRRIPGFDNEDYKLLSKLFTFSCKDGFNPRTRKKVPGKRITMMKGTGKANEVLLPMYLGKKLTAVHSRYQHVESNPTHVQWTDTIALKQMQVIPYQHILTKLVNEGCSVMNLFTGFGKTVLSAKMASQLGVKTAVLVPGKHYVKSWVSTFNDFTTASVATVPVPSKRTSATDQELMNSDVIVCLVGRTEAIPDDVRRSVGLFIVDEADTFCTNTRIQVMLGFQPKYLLACTATLKNENGSEKAIEILCGVENRVIRKIDKKLFVNVLYTGVTPQYETVDGVKSWPSVMRSLMKHNGRNMYIMTLIKHNLALNKKTLVLFELKEHLEVISELLTRYGVAHGKMYGSNTGYDETMCLLGTTSKIGRGFDEKGFTDDWNGTRISSLIMCNTMKAESSFLQYIGRAERSDEACVFLLIDDDKSAKKHEKAMMKILERRGNVVMSKMEISCNSC